MDIVVTPNAFSFLALLVWMPIVIVLFRKLRPAMALAVSTIAAILLLPERVYLFDPPVFSKDGGNF